MHSKSQSVRETIAKRSRVVTPDLKKVTLSVSIKSVDEDKRIVTGEVYAPYILDSHSEMMEPEDVEFMAHAFLTEGLTESFDVMHDNKVIEAKAVESWIARGHPDYNEGAWVLSTKIFDDTTWKLAKTGKLGGYSIEAYVTKVSAEVEFEVEPQAYGFVEPYEDHDHAFFVFLNNDGVVTGGYTSKDNGHRHIIRNGTRTEVWKKHSHRYFLP